MKNIKDYDLEDLKKEMEGLGEKEYRENKDIEWI